jgi:hypothetical protein
MHLPARYVYQFQCPACYEHMILPRQSPLGKYGDQQYLPMDTWPIEFLCFRLGQVCLVQVAAIHQETIAALAPTSGEADLWQIVCECDHENCGEHRAIYTKYLADETAQNVCGILLSAAHVVPCSKGHTLKLNAKKMEAEKLPF